MRLPLTNHKSHEGPTCVRVGRVGSVSSCFREGRSSIPVQVRACFRQGPLFFFCKLEYSSVGACF